MGLSRTVSEINGDIRLKLPIFPTPVYLTPPAEAVRLGIWYRRKGTQKLMGLPVGRKSFKIGLTL